MDENSLIRDSHDSNYQHDSLDGLSPKNQEDLIEESIDDFLRTPIDSRCNNDENIQAFERYEEAAIPASKRQKTVQITVKPTNFNTVLFDWDSTIHRLSNKLKPEKARPKSRGLPNIAQREIQKENQELKPYVVNRQIESRERKIVYPPRKNELPLLRKAPRLLSGINSRRRRRFD